MGFSGGIGLVGLVGTCSSPLARWLAGWLAGIHSHSHWHWQYCGRLINDVFVALQKNRTHDLKELTPDPDPEEAEAATSTLRVVDSLVAFCSLPSPSLPALHA